MLGKWIHAQRREKGMKQDELASKMGLKKQTISGWETDRYKPQPVQLKELEKIFGSKFNGGEMIQEHDLLLEIKGKIAATPFRLAQLTNNGKFIKGKPGEAGCYALEIEGDSMEPVYLHGDVIVCRPVSGVKISPFSSEGDDDASYIPIDRVQDFHNKDAVILHNGESCMKRIRITRKGSLHYDLELQSLNSAHPTVKLHRGDEFEIQAWVKRVVDRPVPQ